MVPLRTFSTMENLEFSIEPSDPVFRNNTNNIKDYNLMLYASAGVVFPVSASALLEFSTFYSYNFIKDKLYLQLDEVNDFAIGCSLGFLLKI